MKKETNFFSKLSFIIASIVVFLVPVIFFPTGRLETNTFKVVVLSLGTLLLSVSFILALIRGESKIRRAGSLIPLVVLPLVLCLSAFFGIDPHTSFLDVTWSAYSVNVLAIVCLFSAVLIAGVIKNKEDVFRLITLFFSGTLLAILIDIVRFVANTKYLSAGFLGITTPTLTGSFNDLAIMLGLVTLMAMIAADFMMTRKVVKTLLGVVALLGLVIIAFANFFLPFYFFLMPYEGVMAILGLISVVAFCVLNGRKEKEKDPEAPREKRRYPIVSILVIIAAAVLIFTGARLSSFVGSTFNLSYFETNLSWQGSFSVADDVFAKNPVLGSGPNTFMNDWNLYKPAAVNATNIWNTDFYTATGFLPTEFITTGIVGTLAWLVFVFFLLRAVYLLLRSKNKTQKSLFLNLSVALGVLYLLLASVFYGISTTLIFGLFLLFACVSVLAAEKDKRVIKKVTTEEIIYSYPPALWRATGVIAIILLLGWLAFFAKKTVAVYYATDAFFETTPQQAIQVLIKAATLDPNQAYLELLASAYLSNISQVLGSVQNNALTDAQTSELLQEAQAALNATAIANTYSKQNFRTFISSGSTYETIASYGAKNFYDTAIQSYTKAASLSPVSPLPYLLMARVEARRGNYDQSEADITKALQIKPNYSDAYALYSQLSATKGDTTNAEKYLEQAVYLAPDNSNLSYQLGVVKYNEGDYQNAANYFYNALKADPTYLRARFGFAVALYDLGDTKDAISQMTIVDASGVDSAETGPLLQKMKAGQQLFVSNSTTATASSTPAVTTKTASSTKKTK